MNERDKWDYVKRNLHKMELIHRSPYVPHTFQGWMHFKSARAGDVLKEGNEKLARRQKDNRYVLSGIEPVKILPVMKGKTFNDGRSLVLAEKTIWSRPDKPSLLEYPTAPWPCKEEMREEGDERNTSRFGRFLGLPRHPGNETVNWKQKKHLLPLEFDNIWHLPDKESYERSREEIDDETRELMESLLGEDLLEAIDS
ncbi:uncharacterized protein KY384_004486 [Bacidia gigantensis]|uniref:uncharacterized protein n=1 Tax=Bacidia gigantensis TaxID=2732470 RepID=UPI001D047B54|nr:uncharacterized protein KY384_004486 [Bacidia gigantensis]KAG8531128.1 hypothetical protein KY384_004486 [Bacidia gigantensis]